MPKNVTASHPDTAAKVMFPSRSFFQFGKASDIGALPDGLKSKARSGARVESRLAHILDSLGIVLTFFGLIALGQVIMLAGGA